MKRIAILLVAAICALPLLGASAALPQTDAALRGADYIYTQLRADGAYGSDSLGQTEDAIIAIRAAGYDPAKDHLAGGQTPADYFTANVASATTAAAAGKAALAAKALGLDPKSVNGTDLIATVNAGFDGTTGQYAADDFSQSLAMLGLACTGNSVPAAAATALKGTQVDDGGWGFSGASDPDTTALAIQALLAAGVSKSDSAVTKAITYLKTTQLPDGGWGFAPDSNTSSTAFAVQALLTAGESIDIPIYIQAGPHPVDYLLSQQATDGSFSGFDTLLATNQVVPALEGRTFCDAPATPITRVRAPATPTPVPTTPTATATPVRTTAPGAPNTGSGAAAEGPSARALEMLGIALLLTSIAGATLATRSRRQ